MGDPALARSPLQIDNPSHPSPARAAIVSVTVTARAAVYSGARCPACRRLLMAVPGTPRLTITVVAHGMDGSGRGRVLECRRCRNFCEVIEHG